MRSNAAWHDVCILNLSTHGLGIQSADPPSRGAYVEICRGRQTVIARVAWMKGHRAGLRSQDPIFIDALIRDTAAAAPASTPAGAFVERRRAPRPSAKAHDDSRLKARAIEFASFGAIVIALAFVAVSAVNDALSRPMTAVRQALDPPPQNEGNG